MKINLSKLKRCNQVWEGMTPNDSKTPITQTYMVWLQKDF